MKRKERERADNQSMNKYVCKNKTCRVDKKRSEEKGKKG